MNWTGGRLQRHSKAHANTLLKAQKDHFARARLRFNEKPVVPSSLQCSILKIRQDQQTGTESPHPRRKTLHDSEPGEHSERTRKAPCKGNHNRLRNRNDQNESTSPSPHTRLSQNRISSTHEVQTLADVKRNLLKRPDWMGLGPARPAKIDFTPAVESERVGRRKRVTTKDLRRHQDVIGGHKVQYNIIKPFQDSRDRVTGLTDHSDSFSIRVGSNIHQSQTVQPARPFETLTHTSPESVSTGSMLLDRLEAKLPKNPLLPKLQSSGYLEEELYLQPTNEEDEHFEMTRLVPLEQARSFASFADLQVYSSSENQSRSISTLNTPMRSVQQPALGPHLPAFHASGPFVNGFAAVSSRRPDERPPGSGARVENNSPGQSMLDSRQSQADDTVSSERFSVEKASKPSISDVPETDTRAAASIKDVAEEAQVDSRATQNGLSGTPGDRSLLYTQATRPLYTLEHQVELEIQPRCQLRNLRHASHESKNAERSELVRSDKFDGSITYEESRALIGGFSKLDSPDNSHTETKSVPSPRCVKRASNGQAGGDQQDPYNLHPSSSSYNGYLTESFMASPTCGASNSEANMRESPAPLVLVDKFASRRQGDQNEAWIRERFSEDFKIIQKQFTFAKSPLAKHSNGPALRPLLSRGTLGEERNICEGGYWKQDNSQNLHCSGSAKSFRTSANTVLNAPSYRTPDKVLTMFQPSETDFLTQMSPMEGCLDERIADVSVYNNAPRTERSFIQAPSLLVKRSAFDAFGAVEDETASQSLSTCRARSASNLMVPHRQPLQVLRQPEMRYRAHHEPALKTGAEWDSDSRSGWKRASGRQLTKPARSTLQVRYMQTSRGKPARSLNCPPLAGSATCQRIQSSIERREDTTGATNPGSFYRTSPSLSIPRHSTPLESIWAGDHMDLCDDEQTINHREAAATSSSNILPDFPHFRKQAVSRCGQTDILEQALSSSSFFADIPAPSSTSPQASNAEPFVFRRPRPLNSQFSRPPKDATFFRQPTPNPIYLH